jgi:hypothetical protein
MMIIDALFTLALIDLLELCGIGPSNKSGAFIELPEPRERIGAGPVSVFVSLPRTSRTLDSLASSNRFKSSPNDRGANPGPGEAGAAVAKGEAGAGVGGHCRTEEGSPSLLP